MQGMMIQDFQAAPKSGGTSVATGTQESSEQPFGEVLGTETEMTAESVEKNQTTEPVETSQGKGSEMEAAPFFMAALFDQSAAYVKPSENADLIAAAERTQELIGGWLQSEQEGEDWVEEVMTAALDVLGQVTEVSGSVVEEGTEILPPVLSDADAIELRELMAVMMQNGLVQDALQGHPMIAEIQKQLELVQPVAAVVGGKGSNLEGVPQVSSNFSLAVTGEADPENLQSETTMQPQVAAGLQENQIAKILSPRQQQPASKASVEVVPMVMGEGEVVSDSDGDFSLETAKPDVSSFIKEIQSQQSVQVGSTTHRVIPEPGIVAPKIMQLPSGQQLAESQLVDQVVTHLAGSVDGESGRMRLRLHPAELGSVRLDLIVDGDRLRVHLQTQTQQVQEVLDRYLPQLREALQQQGLKIDEFRVDVQTDQDRAADQGFASKQQHEDPSEKSSWRENDLPQAEVNIPLQQLMQNADGGISLRV